MNKFGRAFAWRALKSSWDDIPPMTDKQIAMTHFLDILEKCDIISIDTYIDAMLRLDDEIEKNE
jgi:hypothetical protein